VKSLPAMRSITKRPREASFRNPETVIEPSGKANLAAVDRRIGASPATPLGSVQFSMSGPMVRLWDCNRLLKFQSFFQSVITTVLSRLKISHSYRKYNFSYST
jgi:hypothetical protein